MRIELISSKITPGMPEIAVSDAGKTIYQLTQWKWPTSWLSRICVVFLFYLFNQHARNGASRPWQDVGWNTGCCLTTSLLLGPWRKQEGLHIVFVLLQHVAASCCSNVVAAMLLPWRKQKCLQVVSALLQQVVAASCCFCPDESKKAGLPVVSGLPQQLERCLQQCCCNKLLQSVVANACCCG